MHKFSANLGFLWTELSLPNAIRSAKAAGFHAVECHWPYHTSASQIKLALHETNMRMLGLNTRRGDVANGENGLSALPDREQEARNAIDEAIEYARAINAKNVHVMAGVCKGDAALKTFISNLQYACGMALQYDIKILIEALNPYDAPGYFLHNTAHAVDIIKDINAPNLKLMFDCYHVGRAEGDVITRLKESFPFIGHIQFASVPGRLSPDQGTLNYGEIFDAIKALGWSQPLGAEYKPNGLTEDTLGWMEQF